MTHWPVDPLTFSKKNPSRANGRSTYIHPPSLAKIRQRTSEEIGNKQTHKQTLLELWYDFVLWYVPLSGGILWVHSPTIWYKYRPHIVEQCFYIVTLWCIPWPMYNNSKSCDWSCNRCTGGNAIGCMLRFENTVLIFCVKGRTGLLQML